MKKRTFKPLVIFSFIIVAVNAVNAQLVKKISLQHISKISYAVNESNASDKEAGAIPAKALKNFQKSFKDVNDVAWFAGLNGFIAAYKTNGYAARSLFDKKGRLIYSIRQYDENELPDDVRASVKKAYWDYSVLVVNEISIPGDANPIYLVLIQNKIRVKRLEVYNNEIEIIEDFIRAN